LRQWQAIHTVVRESVPQSARSIAQGWTDLVTQLPAQSTTKETPFLEFIDTPPSTVVNHEVSHPATNRRWLARRRSYPVMAAVLFAAMIVTLVFFVHPGRQQPGSILSPGGFVSSACGLAPIPMHLPYVASLVDLQMLSPTEGWLGGSISDPRNTDNSKPHSPLLMHFHQCEWTRVSLSLPGFSVDSIEMLSPVEGFAEADYAADASPSHARSALLHYQDGVWQQMTIPAEKHTMGYLYEGWHMVSADEGWIVGSVLQSGNNADQNYVLREQHGKWAVADSQFASATSQFNGAITIDGETWGYGDTIVHYVNGAWQPAQLPEGVATQGFSVSKMDALSSRDIWALGNTWNGAPVRFWLLHFDGTSWSQVPLSSDVQTVRRATNFVMVSAKEGWLAADNRFLPPSSTGLMLHFQNSTWQPVSALPYNIFVTEITKAFGEEAWGIGYIPINKQGTETPGESDETAPVIIQLHGTKWSVYDPHTHQLPSHGS